jgi:hypothetical protein
VNTTCRRAIHDGTGVGNVVNDYIDQRSTPFIMAGRDRDEMLTEYIAAVERGDLIAPRIESAYTDHKYASVESIYSRSKDEHLSDIICSFGLAWHTARRKRPRVRSRSTSSVSRPMARRRRRTLPGETSVGVQCIRVRPVCST